MKAKQTKFWPWHVLRRLTLSDGSRLVQKRDHVSESWRKEERFRLFLVLLKIVGTASYPEAPDFDAKKRWFLLHRSVSFSISNSLVSVSRMHPKGKLLSLMLENFRVFSRTLVDVESKNNFSLVVPRQLLFNSRKEIHCLFYNFYIG